MKTFSQVVLSRIVASIHQDLGDLEQAKEYQQRALAIKLKTLGAEHFPLQEATVT